MASISPMRLTRRALLVRGAALVGAITIAPGPVMRVAKAAGVAKSAVGYQDEPNGDKRCATCVHFVPGNGGAGSCKIVEGQISPKGWCQVWTAK